jgi:hypothetical protein
MKNIFLLWALLITGASIAQCSISPFIQENYEFDAKVLALRDISSNPSDPDYDNPYVPNERLIPYFKKLSAIYENPNSEPIIDSLFNEYQIHANSSYLNYVFYRKMRFSLNTDTPWLDDFIDTGISGVPLLDCLMADYNFSIVSVFNFPPQTVLVIESSNDLMNINALVDDFEMVDDFNEVSPTFGPDSGYNYTGIPYEMEPGYYAVVCDIVIVDDTFSFSVHGCDCISGCACRVYWDIKVSENCGANQHIEENYKSLRCVYCNMPLIIEDTYKENWILPGAVLPFQIDQEKAHQIFKKWVKGLWWAPNKLKKAALDPQNTKGLYSPYWTFDAQLYADYVGQRGEYYYVSVPYTKTVHGKEVLSTRQERRTRWSPAVGSIKGFVDDTLIKASKQRSGVIPRAVALWNLTALQPFDSSYLSGFVTEKYTIPLIDSHIEANNEARNIATNWACRDIGGDTQRVLSLDMTLNDETFKHILLPVYISAYLFNKKRYNFFVNGQTAAISGKRPYSFWKIFLFIMAIILVILIITLVSQNA